MGKFASISLPEPFVEEYIDKILENPKFGYSSRAEVIKEAVRKLKAALIPENE
ncbi:hypothetical protein NEF87_002781 [Candidatus Lokiarchaeum ossiferum]|uniref:Ribbon-helix-helix protein, CopG family n=1 Tax=Candidatus Lokiarchaeum ossiferum TaxID=2951803 RepID=A0ABY6HSL1_9ARCH|nr:hypothetical protein NEF87_002781 [Candidatus Lokiarchaeum sp. B-35]